MPNNTYNCNSARLFSDLMKVTVVTESLSLKQSNVLYKRKTLPGYIHLGCRVVSAVNAQADECGILYCM